MSHGTWWWFISSLLSLPLFGGSLILFAMLFRTNVFRRGRRRRIDGSSEGRLRHGVADAFAWTTKAIDLTVARWRASCSHRATVKSMALVVHAECVRNSMKLPSDRLIRRLRPFRKHSCKEEGRANR